LNFNSIRRMAVPGIAAIALATSLAACGSDNSSDDSSTGATALTGSIAGGGSTAQETAQQAWRGGFNAANPDAKITYDAIGSGDGRAGFIKGTYSFVGSDSPMDSDELKQAAKTCGADPIEFPVFISPIDVAFNLPGVDSLNLDASTVAQIFSGKITMWNDKAIADQNADAQLPATKIIPVHRSDSSGTTDNFTDYLHQAAPADWKTEHDSDWPTTKGEAQEGTSGVVGDVNDNEGAITYADDSAIQATKLGKVSIKVGTDYVAPTAEGAANGLAAATPVSGTPASVLQYSLPRTTTDSSIYPIFMASNEIACPTYKDKATADLVKGFLSYMLSSEGQQVAQKNAYSALLPDAIATKAQALVDQIGS
jgi:phosphate transport system substrate-binding protein